MTKISKTSFGNLYGTSGSTFPDNTTAEISEGDMRTFGNHIQDSVMFLDDHAYRSSVVTAAGTDTYTATLDPVITSYTADQKYFIKFTNANTGAATLNFNALGAKAIKKNGASALTAGDIAAGQIYCLAYDGTNLQIIGSIGGGGTTLASGTYTPTATAIANVASISTNTCQYMRVGSTVTVSGEVNVTPTATAASTSLRMTLPIASALAQEHQCAGTANQELTGGVTIDGIIKGDTTNDEAILKFLNKTSTSSAPWFFTFTYTII